MASGLATMTVSSLGLLSTICQQEHPQVVSKYLEEELRMGRIGLASALEVAKMLGIHCNPFGVIPKDQESGGSLPTFLSQLVTAYMMESRWSI